MFTFLQGLGVDVNKKYFALFPPSNIFHSHEPFGPLVLVVEERELGWPVGLIGLVTGDLITQRKIQHKSRTDIKHKYEP